MDRNNIVGKIEDLKEEQATSFSIMLLVGIMAAWWVAELLHYFNEWYRIREINRLEDIEVVGGSFSQPLQAEEGKEDKQ